MLVKPVSKLKVSMMDTLIASRVIMMSSKKWRAAIIAQSLESYALKAQSIWRSLAMCSCGKYNCIWPCRTSSRQPNVDILRMPGAFEKRIMRASALAAAYSPRAIAQ
jgi:hypothetical protein